MSLTLAAKTTSASSLISFNYTRNTKVNPHVSIIKSPSPLHISYKQNQIKIEQEEEGDGRININRRDVLFILGLGGSLYSTAAALTNPDPLIANSGSAPENHSHNRGLPLNLIEFGSQPQILENTIRVLVPRPKEALTTKSKKDKVFEVLVVDGIQAPHNGPFRFDVYIAKAHNDVVGPDLGEFAGSLVNMAFTRVGRDAVEVQSKGSLELGIGGLVKGIEAEDCEKLAVSLISRLDPVVIGGLRIHACSCSKPLPPVVDENRFFAPFAPHRTATFALMQTTASKSPL